MVLSGCGLQRGLGHPIRAEVLIMFDRKELSEPRPSPVDAARPRTQLQLGCIGGCPSVWRTGSPAGRTCS